MTVQETIKNFLNRYKERKQAYKEFEQNQKVVNTYEQRRLSHNERVLNVLLEQNRQEAIKKQLNYELERRKIQDKQQAKNLFSHNHKMFSDNSIAKTPNIFKNNKSILSSR